MDTPSFRMSFIYHKEFFADRMGLVKKKFPAKKYTWRFQYFEDNEGNTGLSEKDLDTYKIRTKLCNLPGGNSKTIRASLGWEELSGSSKTLNNTHCGKLANTNIRVQDMIAIFNDFLEDKLLPEIPLP